MSTVGRVMCSSGICKSDKVRTILSPCLRQARVLLCVLRGERRARAPVTGDSCRDRVIKLTKANSCWWCSYIVERIMKEPGAHLWR